MTASILIVWTDILSEVEAEFNGWYSREHLPDRVGRMPGFVRGRRYVAEPVIGGAPKYLTLYDLTSAEVMLSSAHVELRKHRKPNDLRFVPLFRNTIKGICDVAGRVDGAASASDEAWLVLLPVTARDAGFARAVADELLPQLAGLTGVVNAVVAMRNAFVTAGSSAKDDRRGDRYVDGLLVVTLAGVVGAHEVCDFLNTESLARLHGAMQFVDAPVVMRKILDLRAG